MSKNKIFLGAATAAYQIEGAYNEDGRGISVWDDYSNDGRCANGETGNAACDHYHRLEEDVKLMKNLGINAYRFSISWTRIIPNGIGDTNEKGIEFYNKLIDLLLENNITPFVTLFHWDYPLELQKMGAWLNPESSDWFEYYSNVVYENFADRVKHFITFNEPPCFIGLGYESGEHAPGYKLPKKDIVVMIHNVLLSHGKSVRALRKISSDAKVGFAPNSFPALPATNEPCDISAAKKSYFDATADRVAWSVSWWTDPIIFGEYPRNTKAFIELEKYLPSSYKDDLKLISQPIDFYCQNIYRGFYWQDDKKGGFEKVNYPINTPRTTMDWAVTPQALYWGPKFLYERYNIPIVISENGMACPDILASDRKIHDNDRINFIESYLSELYKTINDGVDIYGYFYWSLMDNFEWTKGYSQRFGLVYTDYETFERIPKDSYYWYQNFIKNKL